MKTNQGTQADRTRDQVEVEVVVVGAGPTGTTLAAVLARAGVSVMVVDGAPGPDRESSRATTLHALTLAQLDALDGAGREIAERSAAADGSSLWHGRDLLAQAHWDRLPGPYACMANLAQTETEAILRRRLEGAGGAVRWGSSADAVDADGDRVEVVVRDADGAACSVSASYLVGCDGAHSAVRRAIGISLAGTTHEERFLLADVELDTDLDRDRTHVFVSTRGVFGVMPLPDGRFRLNGTMVDGEVLDTDTLPTLMTERLGPAADRVRLVDVSWANEYRTHSRVADRYREGLAFLAGDAAHLLSPVGGQGMNLGIQDAINLGWKLIHVQRGWASPVLLDTYEQERRPAARSALRMAERNTRMFTARRPIERMVRNAMMRVAHRLAPVQRQLTWGPAGYRQPCRSDAISTAHRRRGPQPGQHLARWVGADVDWLALAPHVEGPSRLLTGMATPTMAAFESVAADHGVEPVSTPDVPAAGTMALLVRPDGVIGWVGADPGALDDHLGALAPQRRATTTSRPLAS